MRRNGGGFGEVKRETSQPDQPPGRAGSAGTVNTSMFVNRMLSENVDIPNVQDRHPARARIRSPWRRIGVTWTGIVLLALTLPACSKPRAEKASQAQLSCTGRNAAFRDVTDGAGIRHVHRKPMLDHKLDNIMPWVASVGAAAAAGDYNNDGWIDLYVTNSAKGTPNYLYRNNGDGTLTDVAPHAGLADVNGEDGVSMECIWGDFDSDGDADLYLVRWGRNALFRNKGDGTFTDVTERLFRRRDGAPGSIWANGNAAVFLDYNLDGRLDIYVGNYFEEVDLWNLTSTTIMHDSFETARNGGRNFLYRQEADGTFTEVAVDAGVDDPGWTLAVGSADVDNDGWQDVYVADDFGPDQLYVNQRDGTFRNVTDAAIGQDTKKGMSVDFGDFDGDGWLDIYVANITTAEYLQEGNMLWRNNGVDEEGQVSLIDVSLETGTYDGGWGWGAKFFDYDNDGDLDIVAVNGFISAGEGNYWYDLASWTVTDQDPADARNWPAIGDRSFSGHEPNRLWRNDGSGTFTERARELGVDSTRDGRGVVCFDYDNDGDLDLFVANQNQPPHLYRNDASSDRHWLLVRLDSAAGTGANRDGVGTRVTVVTNAGRQIREKDGGNGFCGQSDPRLHFGLGACDRVRLLEVRWPDGGLQYVEDVPADRLLTIRQEPERYASRIALARETPRNWPGEAVSAERAPRPPIPQGQAGLEQLEERLRAGELPWALASEYRAQCAASKQHDRAIEFLKTILNDRPSDNRARIQLACAYVDKIPTCGGMAAIVSKGTFARRSLDQLDQVMVRDRDSWIALYCRGMNHLHWPRALRHSEAAAEDLQRCVDIQGRENVAIPRSYYLRTHLLLGDAWVKAGRDSDARAAWKEGLRHFPEAKALIDRLAINDDAALLRIVESERSLEQPIDTDLSFLDQEP